MILHLSRRVLILGTKECKVAVSASCHYDLALRTHIEKARVAGCSREEIEHAIILTAPTAGFPSMMTALLVMRECFEGL